MEIFFLKLFSLKFRALNRVAASFLVCHFVSAIAHSEPVPLFTTEMGFHSSAENSVPNAVEKSADSIFEARVIYDKPAELTILDLTKPNFAQFEKGVETLEVLSQNEKAVINAQLQRCRKEKIERECPVFFTIEKATAFLAGGDGSYLVTNAHVVDGFLKLASWLSDNKPILELLKSPQRILIFLFDRDGKMVFNPFLNSATVVTTGKPSRLAQFQNRWYSEDSDYAVLKLDKVLNEPLKIATSYQVGEPVFQAGFPACTGCASAPNKTDPEENRDRGQNKNSNGVGFYWTEGKIQSLDTANAYLNADWYLAMAKTEQMIFTSADSQVGMSGSPILNSNGEVIGVFAGAKPKINSDGSMSVLSRGVRPPEFNSIH